MLPPTVHCFRMHFLGLGKCQKIATYKTAKLTEHYTVSRGGVRDDVSRGGVRDAVSRGGVRDNMSRGGVYTSRSPNGHT